MRQCPFEGCTVKIADSLFACGKHWRQLNRTERNQVWSAYEEYQKNAIGVEELRELQQRVLDSHAGRKV